MKPARFMSIFGRRGAGSCCHSQPRAFADRRVGVGRSAAWFVASAVLIGACSGEGEARLGDAHLSEKVTWSWGEGRTVAPAGEFVDVAVNELMSCGVRVDGALACWGDIRVEGGLPEGEFSQVVLRGGYDGFGGASGCALGVDGAVECFVDPEWRWANPTAPPGVFVDISVGARRWCAVRADGAVVCWGAGFDGDEALAESGFARVFASQGGSPLHPVCALDEAGRLTCWDPESHPRVSEAAVGPFVSVSAAPYRVGVGSPARSGEASLGSAVAVGDDGASSAGVVCAVHSGGGVECWDGSGQSVSGVPAGEFSKVAAGARHRCALARDGSVSCWGDNEAGQRDPVEDGPFADVWVLDAGSCASRADGELVCWGDPGAGFDPASGPFSEIVAGRLHGCGLRLDATVTCWALLDELLLHPEDADGLSDAALALHDYHSAHWSSQDVAPQGRFVQLAAGETHSCALSENGEVVCWGDLEKHAEPPEGQFTQISAAGTTTCARSVVGDAVCWGSVGTATVPPLAPFEETMSHIVATAVPAQPCMLDAAGALKCWQPDRQGAQPLA